MRSRPTALDEYLAVQEQHEPTAACRRWIPPSSRSGASPPQAATSFPSRLATRNWPRRSPRRRSPTAQPPRPTRCGTKRHSHRLRFTGRAVLDAFRGLVGCDPLLVPLAGEPGTVTFVTTPDSLNGAEALNPGNKHPDWQQEVAAHAALRVGFYRPGPYASRVRCPLLVLAYDDDGVALLDPPPARRSEPPAENSSGCPADTTSRSWTVTNRPPKHSCPSYVGTCSTARRRGAAPPPSHPECNKMWALAGRASRGQRITQPSTPHRRRR
jgi:hypothetical protein